MAGYSKVIMVGNLTRDPELRYTSSGTAVADFAVAVNRVTGGGSGRREEVAFIDCTAWAKTAEFITQYFSKGKAILVEGHFTQDRWEDQNTGQQRTKLKVTVERTEFVGGRGSQEGRPGAEAPPGEDIPF